MADDDAILLPSVLDRLLDEGPNADRPRSRAQHLADLRDSVRRDLEALLNTQRCCRRPPEELAELGQSLLAYGLPDFLSINAAAKGVREEFCRSVEEIIRRFEPRFKSVTVTLLDDDAQTGRQLRFRVDALMYADPVPEHVRFDSLLEPASHTFAVVGSDDD
jgi:type VI secretion system protein ImpF